MSASLKGSKSHVSGVKQGTPMYIAPEIYQTGQASKAADVYSFGVVMWELSHNQLAWDVVRKVGVDL